jgi:plastocyanin
MEILVDNRNVKDWNIRCLDYSKAFGVAAQRTDERIWHDKSGIDRNRTNMRYDAREFVMEFIVKADDIQDAYADVKSMTDYMFSAGVFVLSLRDTEKGIRKAILCTRTGIISPDVYIRVQNSVYVFKMALKDVNPNAVVYYTDTTSELLSILYTKGKNAYLYWGNGESEVASNSGTYTKSIPGVADGELYDVFIDVDKDTEDVEILEANFVGDLVSGIKPHAVQFIDISLGDIVLWNWDFGDGGTSSEQNPSHTYTEPGTYTVSLRVFNEVNGSHITTKEDYIFVRNARLLINSTDVFLINTEDKLLKN